MEPTPRLRQEQRDALVPETQSELTASATAVVFDTPEDLLRHDRMGSAVPAGVEERLGASLHSEAPVASASPWWRRWLGGSRTFGRSKPE